MCCLATIRDVRTCTTLGWVDRYTQKSWCTSIPFLLLSENTNFLFFPTNLQNRADNTISNFFIFGYIVGENNFVGEWRLAATDPLNPTWGGAFVMSRKID
jgi:hypothetical protein